LPNAVTLPALHRLKSAWAGFLLACCLMFATTASAETARKALVVGIDAYQNVPPLERAVNDARSVAAALTRIGFFVTVQENTDRRALLGAVNSFAATLVEGDETVIFFAGHGVAMGGRNFLLAADVPALQQGDETFLVGEGIAVDLIMETIKERKVRVATYILDACRDNPFADAGTRGVGGSRGLASPPQVQGTFIIYSAAEGQAALDRLPGADTDRNSVFTRVLLPLLAVPDMEIADIAEQAREEVYRITEAAGRSQWISFYNELIGDYVLNPGTGTDPKPVSPEPPADASTPAAAPAPAPDPQPMTREDIIRATQAELLRIGCNAGMPDGVAGQHTRTALRFYAMLKGWQDDLPGEIGSDALLAALEVEPERICASQWIAARMPMALSGDWAFSMLCPNNLGAEGSAILVVDGNGNVRGAITNQSGQTRGISGKITPDRFSGEIDGNGDRPLAFDLPLSAYETKIEGIDAFGCQQSYSR
jgi:hypothetical protein